MHALSAVVLASVVLIHTANAVQCNATYTWYKWAINSIAQDPCQLVSDLLNSCSPNANPLQPLTYNTSGMNFYHGPSPSVQNVCTCSYVMYNLMAACGDCQVGLSAPTAWPTYQHWTQSCDAVNTGKIYPGALPDTFEQLIPVWARFSTKESGDPRWSYGLSYAAASGHFLVNTILVSTTPSSCSPHPSSSAPLIGTAFAGFLGGLLISALIFLFQRRRRARVIPPPTRYHTTPDNTPLHPLVPRPAHAQGTTFLRRMLEHENDPHRIEPFDISAAVGPGSFPPHPAVFPPMRGHTFPPTVSIAGPSRGPSRQPSSASLNPNPFGHPSPLRHSRSYSHAKPASRPHTAASQFSTSGSVGPGPGPSMVPMQNISPSEPPSPLLPDRHWPDVPGDPPAYRRKT